MIQALVAGQHRRRQPLLALDNFLDLGVRCAVFKRVLLWSGLFLAGLLAGLAMAWFLGMTKRTAASPDEHASRGTVTITLSATIDGSDRFIFTRDNVWNEHGRWQPPQKVLFNGEPWEDLTQPPGDWPELARNLDLRGAILLTREGRDLIVLERTAEGFDICFGDTPMGAGKYTASISIPRK